MVIAVIRNYKEVQKRSEFGSIPFMKLWLQNFITNDFLEWSYPIDSFFCFFFVLSAYRERAISRRRNNWNRILFGVNEIRRVIIFDKS